MRSKATSAEIELSDLRRRLAAVEAVRAKHWTWKDGRFLLAELTEALGKCPTCTWPHRETVGLRCPTCGWDYAEGEKPS